MKSKCWTKDKMSIPFVNKLMFFNTSSAIIILCTCLSINTNSCMKSNIEANGPHRSPEHEKLLLREKQTS